MRTVLDKVIATFSHDITDVDGMLLLATKQALRKPRDGVLADPIAIEATCNKRYVADLIGQALPDTEDNYTDLMTCGRTIIQVWSERIALRFPSKRVLFFLGGSESVILRFHVRRPEQCDWTDLANADFLTASRLEVYELADTQLVRLH